MDSSTIRASRLTDRHRVARQMFALAICALILFPLAFLAALSLSREWFFPNAIPGRWTTDNWAIFGENTAIFTSLRTSVALALGTGALSSIAGLLAGREISRLHGWARRLGLALAFLPVAIPPLALSIGLQFSALRLGIGGRFAGVLLAHSVPAIGYTTLFFIGIFAVFDDRVEDEARSLGATPRDVLMRVTLPLLRRPLVEAFALGFLVSWAQVPLTLLIGQGLVKTLPLELMAFVSAGQDHLAATAGLVLTIPPLALLAAAGLALRRMRVVIA
ncbi:MAG: ABC transporter permease subunit [Gemmatimonadaceae bacterium]